MEKQTIQVRKGSEVIETIKRKVWLEAIGNFNPMFCRYRKSRCLVKSEEGDISDPFRREESYLKTLYIDLREEL